MGAGGTLGRGGYKVHKCASPDAPQTRKGTEAAAWGLVGLQPSPRRGPHRNGHCLRLPDGKDLEDFSDLLLLQLQGL